MGESGAGLLEGLRVLDCSRWQPGQYAGQLLCDLGAEVIKVEPPGGDPMRAMADRFFTTNGSKASVVADLKTPEGLERVLDLASEADVLIECYRPGVADRLGIGYARLAERNPALVYCSISGYGQVGPMAAQGGHDMNFQALAGALHVIDGLPEASGVLVADQGSGLAAAFAILAAVLCARRTGEGEHIDVSMTDVVASWVAPMGPIDEARPLPVQAGSMPAYGAFATQDGSFVVLGVFSEDNLFDSLVRALGLGDLVGIGFEERSARGAALAAEIRAAVAERPRDELLEALWAVGVPATPVLSRDEMLVHPQFTERGLLVSAPDGSRSLAHPVRYERHPARRPGLPPGLGDHRERGFAPRSGTEPT
jgi:crotonobetainyl-CoA:carnitine CoA-transferase CaiB-like acyl-CoA transferase